MYSCISASNFQLLNYLVSTILKRNQLQKWSRRLNDICKTKRLWRTLCHLALWLVLTGSRLKELGRHLQRSENHWQMPLLSCWRRNFANKLIWCVIFSLMWTHLGNSLYNSTDKTIYNVYIREGGRNGVLGYHTFIISAASLRLGPEVFLLQDSWSATASPASTQEQSCNTLRFALLLHCPTLCLLLSCIFLLIPTSVQLVEVTCYPFTVSVLSMSIFLSYFSFGKSKLNWLSDSCR